MKKIDSNLKIRPVILCGGSGTRLWPLSRGGYPKQFLKIGSSRSLFQGAVNRFVEKFKDDVEILEPLVITGENHRFLVLEQLNELRMKSAEILVEPVSRNTAPALTLASLSEFDLDPMLLVMPSDQYIQDSVAFSEAVTRGIQEALHDNIVIFGIKPQYPETGYGYIKVDVGEVDGGHTVSQFVEKPDASSAADYVCHGSYFWNAGIFLVKASIWLKALKEFRDDIAVSASLAWGARSEGAEGGVRFIYPGKEEFSKVPSDSIDYAVLEKCPGSNFRIKMMELDAGWCDLGSWSSLARILPKDDLGNILEGDVVVNECRDSIVHSTSRLVCLQGVEGLVVVETPDAVLVSRKESSQDVKKIVSQLCETNREEYDSHRKVHRPWGWFDSVISDKGFKVKRIHVNPGQSLSLQKHYHRSEHWVVVSGSAEVINGSRTLLLEKGDSTFIPVGEVHRLKNPSNDCLEIIETQLGSYLGEDDIERLQDDYGRGK